jgi:hypothetical protein
MKNICLPQIPEQITPQNIGLYLQEWTKIPIDLIDSMPRISRSNAVVESLRALPIPKLNNSGEFWGQVPEKDIEGCLEGLFKLARLYNYEKDTDVSSPAGFIELNAALAMAEALARRKPEYKLRGYKLPYQQIFRFATNPSLILVNPVDHSRLEALLAYADSRVETHFPLTLQNDPTDFLFALHPESFTIDEKAVAQVQEWKYYTQFLKTKPVYSSLSFWQTLSPIQEKIAHVAMNSSQHTDLLPKGIVYLRNLAIMAQIFDPTQEKVLKRSYKIFSDF